MERLDKVLVRRGLARSRTEAQALIGAGQITIPGMPVVKPRFLAYQSFMACGSLHLKNMPPRPVTFFIVVSSSITYASEDIVCCYWPLRSCMFSVDINPADHPELI